jgi:hypothetical protein
MSRISHKHILATMAVPAIAAVTLLGAAAAASAASASAGPRGYTVDSAGYSVTHAQFRYLQGTVYLRPPAKFAAVDDGVSWETHLAGTDAGGHAVEVNVNIGGDPQTESGYHSWANVNGQPMTTSGDTAFSAGQSVTESIYYNRGAGVVSVAAYDRNGDSFYGSAHVGSVSFGKASIYGGFDQGSSFTAPASPVTLGNFTGVTVTTYSGHHGSLADWYAHNKVFATSDGAASGAVRAAPANLTNGGSSFSVFFEPAS